MEDIEVWFPGGKRVDARSGTFVVHTDQPPESGGHGTAIAPFEMVSSIRARRRCREISHAKHA